MHRDRRWRRVRCRDDVPRWLRPRRGNRRPRSPAPWHWRSRTPGRTAAAPPAGRPVPHRTGDRIGTAGTAVADMSARRACPSRPAPRAAARPRTGAAGSWRSRRSRRRLGCRCAGWISAARGTRDAQTNRRPQRARVSSWLGDLPGGAQIRHPQSRLPNLVIPNLVIPNLVIPAKAGTTRPKQHVPCPLGSRFRGNDKHGSGNDKRTRE